MSGRHAAVEINAAELFRSEVARARKLGFRIQIRPGRVNAKVRLQSVTPRARSACFSATGKPNQAIEAVIPDVADQLDGLREAIRATLKLAEEAMG